jgi:hypothetical protein
MNGEYFIFSAMVVFTLALIVHYVEKYGDEEDE